MSEQVLGEAMTIFMIMLALLFIGFFAGFMPYGSNFWAMQSHSAGIPMCTNVFSYTKEMIFVYINTPRVEVM